jgi:hypothetical protein
MLDLAKYMELYECHPDIVSKGKQKTLELFAKTIGTTADWPKNNTEFNLFYYKRVVAIAILYKRADEIVKQSQWYKEKRSYKANIVAYTLSIIFNYIRKNKKGYEIDFNRIWNLQDIYAELEEQIQVLSKEVYDFITGPRDTENVTEWCKKELCWTRAQARSWTINDQFIYTLIRKEEIKEEIKEEKDNQKLANEIDVLKEIMARGTDYWKQMLGWGMNRRVLSDKEISILKMIINMNITGRIPNDKQAKAVISARERLIKEGMPLQF